MIDRRSFLLSSLATTVRAAVPRNLKITAVKVIVTNPGRGPLGNFVIVKLETNQPGLWGWGDCTCSGSELGVARFLEEHLAPGLMNRNPMQLEDLWQTLSFCRITVPARSTCPR
jgi:mannonate dehydratase